MLKMEVVALVEGLSLPRTSLSKSSSPNPAPEEVPKWLSLDGILIKSLPLVLANPLVEVDASSRSFRVCSTSIFPETTLIRLMYSANCCKLSNGPRLKLQRTGRISMAKNSVSAILPTSLNTARAAIMTAGSLVLMPLRSGTTFSWTVYLSRVVLLVLGEIFVGIG